MPDILDILRADNSNTTKDGSDSMAPSGGSTTFESDGFSITAFDDLEDMRPKARVRLYPKASWLDALLPQQAMRAESAEPQRTISSVNSDDNGLYRMFVGVSP